MKKFLVILLALAMVFSMGGAAFANEAYEESSPVKINKVLTINNDGTLNPAETFNFTVGEGAGTRDGANIIAPDFDPETFTIDVAQEGTTGTTNIILPDYTNVGVYTYPITEVAGNTAGMDYDTATYNLVVTVINNPDFGKDGEPAFLRVLTLTDNNVKNVKVDEFQNSFNAGDLTINKVVTGNYGDPNDTFTVTVTLTPHEGKDIKIAPIVATGSTSFTKNNETGVVTITYTVKKGSEYTIQNIPYDVDYTVVETDNGDYTVTYTNATGEINAASTETTITNHRDTTVQTGVNLDNLPYILILVGAVGGLVLFAMRRRQSNQ